MNRMDIKVYDRFRKISTLPGYHADTNQAFELVHQVPIFLISTEQLDAVIRLEDFELIRQHCQCPLIIFTDRRRVLAVDPQGYHYARYVCVMDVETVQTILNQL